MIKKDCVITTKGSIVVVNNKIGIINNLDFKVYFRVKFKIFGF